MAYLTPGEWVRYMRTRLGLTQREASRLAAKRRLDHPEWNFSRMEATWKRVPDAQTYRDLCSFFESAPEEGLRAMGYIDADAEPPTVEWSVRLREVILQSGLDSDIERALLTAVNFAKERVDEREGRA